MYLKKFTSLSKYINFSYRYSYEFMLKYNTYYCIIKNPNYNIGSRYHVMSIAMIGGVLFIKTVVSTYSLYLLISI